MDSRSNFFDVSEHIEEEETVEKKEKPVRKKRTVKAKSQTVKLRLLKDLQVNAYGNITGKRYSWSGGGSVVDVDIRDKDKLLKKTSNPVSCCQDVVNEPYFELVE